MPRQQSAAACYLDMHRIVVEKTRLQRELTHLEARRDRIQQRLSSLTQTIDDLDHTARRLQETGKDSEPNSIIYPPANFPPAMADTDIQTVTLDY